MPSESIRHAHDEPGPPPSTVTRRGLLGAGATLTAGLAIGARGGPGAAAAGASPAVFDLVLPAREIAGFSRHHGWLVSKPLDAPARFDLLGVGPSVPARASVAVRVRRHGGRWSRWLTVPHHHGHGGDGVAPAAEPLWADRADQLQLAVSEPVEGLTVHFVGARAAGAQARASAAQARTVDSGFVRQPRILSRSAWGAQHVPPRHAPVHGSVNVGIVHHTDGLNGYGPHDSAAMVLGICRFHVEINGWWDIGYNFLVDRFGQIFEGRAGGADSAIVGAQAGGFNSETFGIGVLGTFNSVRAPRAARVAIAHLLAWKLALHDVPAIGSFVATVGPSGRRYSSHNPGDRVRLRHVSGHRDADQTDCPGNVLYGKLGALRRDAARRQGVRASLSLQIVTPPAATGTGSSMPADSTPSAGTSPTPTAPAPTSSQLSGTLLLSDGRALANAQIELQMRTGSEQRTIATTTTASDGSWSASVPDSRQMIVRAAFRGTTRHLGTVSGAVMLSPPA